jgi:hypothetical protein
LALPAFDNRFSKEHATAREYLEHHDDLVCIQIYSIVVRRRTSESSQLRSSGLGTLRKVPFCVGLESPSDTSDQVAFVSAPAFLAEERFESLDHFGDRHDFEARDLVRSCSVHG